MKFNINEKIKCVLTHKGEEILKKKNPISYKHNYNHATNILHEQLWVVMNIFGGEIFLGGEQMIVSSEIDI